MTTGGGGLIYKICISFNRKKNFMKKINHAIHFNLLIHKIEMAIILILQSYAGLRVSNPFLSIIRNWKKGSLIYLLFLFNRTKFFKSWIYFNSWLRKLKIFLVSTKIISCFWTENFKHLSWEPGDGIHKKKNDLRSYYSSLAVLF